MRGRTYEEVDGLLREGIHRVDPQKSIRYYGTECEALERVLVEGKAGTVIVVLIDKVAAVTECILKFQQQERALSKDRQVA